LTGRRQLPRLQETMMRVSRLLLQSLLGLSLAAMLLPAHALERIFPATAKRGVLSLTDYPNVALDGQQRRLSPGAWIRNQNNVSEVPVMLRGREFLVNYTENQEGHIDRVWILTDEESQKPAPADVRR
jgi:hypothetical protein